MMNGPTTNGRTLGCAPAAMAEIAADTARRIAAIAAGERTTLSTALLTLAGVLVHRYVSWDHVVIGVSALLATDGSEMPSSPAGEPCSFMSLALDGDPAFAAALGRVAEVVANAEPAAGVTTGSLQGSMRFMLQSERQLHSLISRSVEHGGDRSRTPATIQLSTRERAGGLSVVCEGGESDDEALLERIARHFARLTASVAAAPTARISRLEMLDTKEYQQIVVDWNATEREYPEEPIHELFSAQAAATPDADALRCDRQALTYGQLEARATQLAHYLRTRQVGLETPVAVGLERSIDAIVAILAVLKSGGAYVPIDPRFPRARVDEMLADCPPAVIVTKNEHRAVFMESKIPVVCVDRDAAEIAAAPAANPRVAVTPDNAAYILHTSGSAGKPKPIVGTHRSVTNGLCDIPFHRDAPDEICCLDSSLSFGFSLARIFLPLLCGRPLVMLPDGVERDVVSLVAFWESERITNIAMVTPVLRQLLAFGPRLTSKLTRVRTVLVGGALITPELMQSALELMPHAALQVGYASSEIGGPILTMQLTAASGALLSSVGHPYPNTRVYILDAALQPVPVGVVGEIYVAAARLSRGYLNRAAQTAERYVANPFARCPGERLYRTGDLGRYLANGEVELVGRVDDMVKVRGFRIELQEIEAVLTAHTDVDAAAVAVREVSGEPQIVAYVVKRAYAAVRVSDLRDFLARRIPEYMLPSRFVFIGELPLNALGKVDRARLPAVGSARPAVESQYQPPRDDLEAELVRIWELLLEIEGIGVDDHFLEVGGDSLFATMLVSHVCDQYDLNLPVFVLFERPTVRTFAEYLRTVIEVPDRGSASI